ncbi:hypothetical protein U9M48_041411 [Paspalum notatum var. saurae]|uniref:Uncharacterized protein n=1 Tax=Paspalum notatum var. saurae TaxID=547442 RepID=A0AAQ3USL5_PASNO
MSHAAVAPFCAVAMASSRATKMAPPPRAAAVPCCAVAMASTHAAKTAPPCCAPPSRHAAPRRRHGTAGATIGLVVDGPRRRPPPRLGPPTLDSPPHGAAPVLPFKSRTVAMGSAHGDAHERRGGLADPAVRMRPERCRRVAVDGGSELDPGGNGGRTRRGWMEA